MTIFSTFLWNLVIPASISAASVALAARLTRFGWQSRWGIAVGMGLGYFSSHLGILGRPPFPTLDATAMVAWLALGAAAVGSFEAALNLPFRTTWVVRGFFVAGLLALLLRSRIENAWSWVESSAWLVGIWSAVMASWWNLETQAERIPGPNWMFHLGLVSAGWAAVQVLSGGAASGQLDGALAATALGSLTVIGLRPGPALSRGGTAVATCILTGLGLIGYFYSEVPGPSALLLAFAPWATWVDRVGMIRRKSPWARAAVRVMAVLLTVGTAVLIAEANFSLSFEDGSSS